MGVESSLRDVECCRGVEGDGDGTVQCPTKHKRERSGGEERDGVYTSRKEFLREIIARLHISKCSKNLLALCLSNWALNTGFLHPRVLKSHSPLNNAQFDFKCSYFFVVFLFTEKRGHFFACFFEMVEE